MILILSLVLKTGCSIQATRWRCEICRQHSEVSQWQDSQADAQRPVISFFFFRGFLHKRVSFSDCSLPLARWRGFVGLFCNSLLKILPFLGIFFIFFFHRSNLQFSWQYFIVIGMSDCPNRYLGMCAHTCTHTISWYIKQFFFNLSSRSTWICWH